jgi:hypothetical protein
LSGVPKWSNRILGWMFALAGVAGSVWFLAYVGYQPGPAFEGRWTRWLPTIGLAIFGVLAMLASLISLRSRRWAASLALVPCAAIFVLWAWRSNHFAQRPGELFVETAVGRWLGDCWLAFPVLLVPGLYWLFSRRAQPTLARPVRMLWKTMGIISLLALVPVASALMSICLQEDGFRDLCRPVPPFTAQEYPLQTVFTARVLRSFLSPRPQGLVQENGALVYVEKAFWGLPRWNQGLAIVLRPSQDWNWPFQTGQTYFMDADRLKGSLTRFLPIFRDHLCTRTAPIEDAEIQLRVLRDGPPANGVRILGETVRVTEQENSKFYHSERVPGVSVTIEACGHGQRFSGISDQHGVYDVSGLPLGCYRVGTVEETSKMHWDNFCCNPDGPRHSICECPVFVH